MSSLIEFVLEVVGAGAVAERGRCPAWVRWVLRIGLIALVVGGLAFIVIASLT